MEFSATAYASLQKYQQQEEVDNLSHYLVFVLNCVDHASLQRYPKEEERFVLFLVVLTVLIVLDLR